MADPWLSAMRPKTLPAAATPVVVGAALAYRVESFAPLPALAALAGALLLQIGTNLANDYYDHVKGADGAGRAGPRRASASGDIDPVEVRNAALGAFLAAAAVGLYLIAVGGLPILVIGAAGILSGLWYTAGPRPLAYTGLGDLWVFVFFGPVAVMGTVYVQTVDRFAEPGVWMPALFSGIALGALATAILVVNNLRDRPTDAAVGKRTLAVRFGDRIMRIEYTALLVIAYFIAAYGAWNHNDWTLAVPLLSIPLAVAPLRAIWVEYDDRSALNPQLGNTARLLLVYGILSAIGQVLGA